MVPFAVVAFVSGVFGLAVASAAQEKPAEAKPAPPNVLLIYADDVGYGDVGCQGARTIPTPNLDRLAGEGLRCTDAHSPAATCTPSRYAMLTGEYAFRRQGTGVLPGDAKALLEPGRVTAASVLRDAGYRTAVVGKWHLGLGGSGLDWNGDITPGPLDVGFDECFLLPATGDRVPCVYVEGRRVVGLDPADPLRVSYKERLDDEPTGAERPDLLRMRWDHGHDQSIVDGISRIGFMTGGAAARWRDEDMADRFVARAKTFVEANAARPWFLFFSLHDIHVPRVPHARFVGKTPHGPRGDAMVQLDGCVGELLRQLDELGLAERTLVIFTSDNGPVVNDGYVDEAVERLGEHRPAGPFRGGKYSAFEGGTRVPFFVRWPGRVPPGESKALVSQVDLLPTLAALVGRDVPAGAGKDGEVQLAAWLGDDPVGREELVEQAGTLALRQGRWKFIRPSRGAAVSRHVGIELGNHERGFLFDLDADPGEQNDLTAKHPDRAAAMSKRLTELSR
jgi:arylsulfatase A-like enzyme